MSWAIVALILVVAFAGAACAWQKARWAAQCRAGAVKIHGKLRRMYAGEHERSIAAANTSTIWPIDPRGGLRTPDGPRAAPPVVLTHFPSP